MAHFEVFSPLSSIFLFLYNVFSSLPVMVVVSSDTCCGNGIILLVRAFHFASGVDYCVTLPCLLLYSCCRTVISLLLSSDDQSLQRNLSFTVNVRSTVVSFFTLFFMEVLVIYLLVGCSPYSTKY